MIDSHCHLDHSPLYENLDEVIERANNHAAGLAGYIFTDSTKMAYKTSEALETL